MRDTDGGVRTFSCGLYSYGLHTNMQMLADQQEHIYNRFVQTQNVVLKTCRKWWMIETNGERERERDRERERERERARVREINASSVTLRWWRWWWEFWSGVMWKSIFLLKNASLEIAENWKILKQKGLRLFLGITLSFCKNRYIFNQANIFISAVLTDYLWRKSLVFIFVHFIFSCIQTPQK